MRDHHHHWKEDTGVWDGIWSAIESQLGEETAARRPWMRPGGAPATTMAPQGVPVFTVSVTTTILSTTFVTVPYSSADSGSTAKATETSTSTSTSYSTSSSTSSSSTSSSSSSTSISSITTTNLETILPPIVTASSPPEQPSETSITPIPTPSGSSAGDSTADSMIGPDSQPQSQKKAVVGGLSGTIAGLIFVGVLICLALRIRRKKREPREIFDSASEKGIRPLFFRTWTGLSIAGARDQSKPAQQRPQSTSSVTVDEDHRIIRMNTRHWPRPFAPGAGEGYRDSAPHRQLRVMNPDLSSRPITPRRSSDAASFLKKPRSALTGFVFGGPRNTQQQQQQHPLAQQTDVPTIQIVDPALSRECIAPYARTPSFKSYPSINTLPIIRPQTPEDPFTETPNNHPLPPRPQPSRRPSLATLQSAASYLLHPFRSRSNTNELPVQNVRGVSHFSYSTSGSRSSRRSDPFDLDRPSIRGSHYSPRMGSEFQRWGRNENWIVYEGT